MDVEKYSLKRRSYAKQGGKFSEALNEDEWASFYSSVTKSNQRDYFRVGDNGILIPNAANPYSYKLVCYDGDSSAPLVTAVYKLENYDYNIHDKQFKLTTLLEILKRSDNNEKQTRAILQNYTLLYGTLFRKYRSESRRFIKLTRESNQNRQDVGIKSNRAGVNQEIGRELSSGVKENITEQAEVQNGERLDVEKYSIADDIVDDNGTHYGKGVLLDVPLSKIRNLKKYFIDNLVGKQIPVYDDKHNLSIIEFVKPNERMQKDGSKGDRKPIDKLVPKKGNLPRLVAAHAAEIVEVSKYVGENSNHNHKWLDENGWIFRNAYLIDKRGKIYSSLLNIARTKDGRNILYDINKISRIGDGNVFSNGNAKSGNAKRNEPKTTYSAEKSVSQNSKNVNEKFSLDEDYDFSDPSKLDEEELEIYNNRGWSYGLFNKEDMALLSEKVQELKKGTQKADNALWDGSRLVEVNNKLIILGGTFINPEIYNVFVINANKEDYTTIIKDEIYEGFNNYRYDKETFGRFLSYEATYGGEEFVKNYHSDDYKYHARRNESWDRATLPSNFEDYGYSKGRNERYRSSFRTGKSVSAVQLNEENKYLNHIIQLTDKAKDRFTHHDKLAIKRISRE